MTSLAGLLLAAALAVAIVVDASDLMQTMEGKNVDKFKQMLLRSSAAAPFLQGELTLFAPSDDAIRRHGNIDNEQQFVLNHIANVVVRLGDVTLPSEVIRLGSMLPAAPPLYISKMGNEHYVNGAKVIKQNIQAVSSSGKKQRLNVLDSVLEPLAPRTSADSEDSQMYVDLTAGKLLRHQDLFLANNVSIRNFTSQVRARAKIGLFDMPGQHTFFIPVDSAFADLSKELVDDSVIPCHVVPDKLLFTRPLPTKAVEYRTVSSTNATAGALKATVSMTRTPKQGAQVRSSTTQGDRSHQRGAQVSADIVKGNIPVANGVVHLISRPLVVIAYPIWTYIEQEEKQGGRLGKFARFVRMHGGADLLGLISRASSATLLVPSNEAFDALGEGQLDKLLWQDPERAKKVLGLHFVDQRIASDDVRIAQPQNSLKMFGASVPFPAAADKPVKVWFYHSPEDNSTLMVDGLGVAAEVTEADIGCTNGVIHVINRVLGFPTNTIYDKLAKDPMLTSALSLGNQDRFNERLKDPSRKFTYLVPSDAAWNKIHRSFASAYKVLFMGEFGYQSRTLLERHIRIDEALTAEALVDKTTEEGGVAMLRGSEKLVFKTVTDAEGEFTVVEWEGVKARLIRPDLECSNGYVHIIDRVLMQRRDVTLSSVGRASASAAVTASALAVAIAALLR